MIDRAAGAATSAKKSVKIANRALWPRARIALLVGWYARGGGAGDREKAGRSRSRGEPSGRDPVGMQRRLELIDRGTQANLSASRRRA